MLGIGLLVLRAIGAHSPQSQPYLYATFVSYALLAASSFSIWAPWFMAALALPASWATLGADQHGTCRPSLS